MKTGTVLPKLNRVLGSTERLASCCMSFLTDSSLTDSSLRIRVAPPKVYQRLVPGWSAKTGSDRVESKTGLYFRRQLPLRRSGFEMEQFVGKVKYALGKRIIGLFLLQNGQVRPLNYGNKGLRIPNRRLNCEYLFKRRHSVGSCWKLVRRCSSVAYMLSISTDLGASNDLQPRII